MNIIIIALLIQIKTTNCNWRWILHNASKIFIICRISKLKVWTMRIIHYVWGRRSALINSTSKATNHQRYRCTKLSSRMTYWRTCAWSQSWMTMRHWQTILPSSNSPHSITLQCNLFKRRTRSGTRMITSTTRFTIQSYIISCAIGLAGAPTRKWKIRTYKSSNNWPGYLIHLFQYSNIECHRGSRCRGKLKTLNATTKSFSKMSCHKLRIWQKLWRKNYMRRKL